MRSDISIREMKLADARVWESLRRDLWPDGAEDHGPEIAKLFSGQHFDDLTAALVAEDHTGAALGYAELLSWETWKVWPASVPDMSKGFSWCQNFATAASLWHYFGFREIGRANKGAWHLPVTGRDVS